ncbi:transcription cofactor vestigial-like protein 4 [Parasteatoda tepidariorum]|uniref:transcription cofactor vestigial-like protein 4 n=1 Tax=Parasteatoda tepidariorum TaxID=114398 RepID=UPI00077FC90C|nr:transcription cofactor vestigial-like protein 4 [Parasteatoda tepidariorum]XP_015913073.1 transcription cofactor vestigial-like protein 4 [Parasteatoda tepidariorum]XP_042901833.1 transcription cofactor vestigial-like protein 4 [Parasteatoda tepidariorum]XP_042901834.1 transcription cofactor vestigial-like protein 4 [Parasteatoda tepidariorum]XP_042901835.1 transcription cofactor vestigial-like protein 4 [Parasteatoda tepidariorum]
MSSLENKDYILKELPTKGLKLKRHKDRRDSPTIPPVRLRLKSSSSPLSCETDVEKCLSDRSVSSSPDSFSQELSPVFTNMYKTVNSLPSSPLMCEPCEPLQFTSKFEEDSDQPLDMSWKRTDNKDYQCSQQQLRPSVITCASALLRTQCNLSDLAHQMCSANVSDSNHIEVKQTPSEKFIETSEEKNKVRRFGHRREIVSGSCDPVIDEHFRRSLGKDYQQIFSKSTGNNVSITVDEHFAKALGETWHQIQHSKLPSAESFSTTHSSNSSSPHIIPQPHEILS